MRRIILSIIAVLVFTGVCAALDFSEKKSTHFIVYYTGVPEDFVDSVIEYAERYYNDLTDRLGFTRYDYWTWDNRAKIYLYPNQKTYAEETGQPEWSSGVAFYSKKTIYTYPRGAGFFDSLLPHEIGHIVFREVVGRRSIPLWLEEGVACYLEQAKRIGSERVVLDAMKEGRFIALEDLTSIDVRKLKSFSDKKLEIFYAESVNIVNYMVDKFGTRAFNDFLREIREGKSVDRALSYAYFHIRNLSDLSEFWERDLRDRLEDKPRLW